MTATGSSTEQTVDSIRYTLRFPAPHTRYMDVEATFPTDGRPQVELFMAVWTPGSYLVREYERHVETLRARAPSGQTLTVVKNRKNRWLVSTGGAPTISVTYKVYGREMTVRNNWIETGFAMLNGAPTFISMVGGTSRPHEVQLELATGWNGSATALTRGSSPNAYRAEDFDTLVDSPIFVGNPVTRDFWIGGKAHHLVLEGDTSFFDIDSAAADAQKFVEASVKVMVAASTIRTTTCSTSSAMRAVGSSTRTVS